MESSIENVEIIYDYIITEQTELNIKDLTKEGKKKILVGFSKYRGNKSTSTLTLN
ncbi:MAG: hypothetical protein H0X03_03085 [Nitrosopumilus sp.]|nr:hypothetical protein [Nitrosopumilus sp.]